MIAGTLDHEIFAALAAPPDLRGAPLFLTVALAQWAFVCAPVLLVGLWLFGGAAGRLAAVAAALTSAVGLTMAAIISSTRMISRPFMDGVGRNYLGHVIDSSFPSDHATLLFGVAFAFWIYRPTLRHLWMPCLVLALAVGWARVFLGAHYPLDIVGGALVAALAATAAASRPGHRAIIRIAAIGDWFHARLAAPLRRRAAP